MKKKYKSINLKLTLVVLLFVVTIGYATLQTSLTINGTSKINNSTWDVHFETVTPTPGSVTIDTNDNTQYAARIDSNDNTKVDFSVAFNEPGDFYEFTVKAVNGGSIDAMIDDFTKTLKINGTTQDSIPAWLNYTVAYSDGVEIAKNQILEHGKFETYKVRVEFIRDITNAQFNEARGKTLTFEYEVEYIQKGEGSVPVNHEEEEQPVEGTVYTLGIDSNVDVRQYEPFPTSIIQYGTKKQVLQAFKTAAGRDMYVYLKHDVEDNVVKNSYIEFVITDEMVENNPGVVPGVYAIENAHDEASFNRNLNTMRTAFGNNCDPLEYASCSIDYGNDKSIYFDLTDYTDYVYNHIVAYSDEWVCSISLDKNVVIGDNIVDRVSSGCGRYY